MSADAVTAAVTSCSVTQLEECGREAQPRPAAPADDGRPVNRERRQAAAICLQRAHRRAVRRRPSNSTDPITLEELSSAKGRAEQPLFRYVDDSGVLTAIQARALADYGLAVGELVHPLSRARLNSCEVLRLEHTLVGAGFTKYSGLAAQLIESVKQPFLS